MEKRAGDGRRSSSSAIPLVLLATLATVLYASMPCSAQNTKPSQPPKILVGKKAQKIWEPIFFQAINERASKSGLLPLRSYTLPSGDVEVRVWDGFGVSMLTGIALKRTAGVWSGTYLHAALHGFESTQFKREIRAPKGGWAELWRLLGQGELLTLPDQEELKKDGVEVVDGVCYVVEINREGIYRTYCYENPGFHKRPEDKKMVALVALLKKRLELARMESEVDTKWKGRQPKEGQYP